MTIKSVQKVMKIGSDFVVAIPAKDIDYRGIQVGEDLEVSIKRPEQDPASDHIKAIVDLTRKMVARQHEAWQNLSKKNLK